MAQIAQIDPVFVEHEFESLRVLARVVSFQLLQIGSLLADNPAEIFTRDANRYLDTSRTGSIHYIWVVPIKRRNKTLIYA